MTQPQTIFGPGVAWGTPLVDYQGNAIANPQPIMIAAQQDISFDFSWDEKMAYGQNQFPIEAARGKGKITGKISNVRILGQLWNSLVFGQTQTNGIYANYFDQTGSTIPSPSGPYTIVVTPPSSGTWNYGLGVRDSNDLPMTLVASGPTTGQYSVSAGTYTFAAADAGKKVFIDYNYTATSTTAHKGTIINSQMGYAPYFQLDWTESHYGNLVTFTCPRVLLSKFNLNTKLDDYTYPEYDFTVFADPSGNIMTYSTSQ
jgi:hypothetical protein